MWIIVAPIVKIKIQIPKQILYKMSVNVDTPENDSRSIVEGKAKITTSGKVFYNPVQEFNRDLSISVLSTFANLHKVGNFSEAGLPYEDGITILEALSATGLRSIRYAKEVVGVKKIIANDISVRAVQDIEANIKENDVGNIVTASANDATTCMYSHRQDRFDAIDLDPYGCPSIFLDSAIQAVNDGGLLLVTATDMAVLAGNTPETCYSKYGAVSLRIKSCHEMALRILLQSIESHANRYGRYIVPLLSISADFYIRVFVRVYTGPNKCKFTLSKLSMVFHCTGCDSFVLQPLGTVINKSEKQFKFGLPTKPFPGPHCEHCRHPFHMGGPIWTGSLHDKSFVMKVLETAPKTLGTYKRIEGILNVIIEELDVPLYYVMERLTGTLHAETPPIITLRSAILNAGFEVSSTHTNRTAIKTNAPAKVIWDIMRCWVTEHPVNSKWLIEGTPVKNILDVKPEKSHSFEHRPDANPESRRKGYLRYQANPLPHWGPGTRATAMIGDEKITKSKINQNKRKREPSEENVNKT